jgi:hypothetical protein
MVSNRTPYLPPLHTVYLFTQGSGGELTQREGERGNRGEYFLILKEPSGIDFKPPQIVYKFPGLKIST